MDGMIEERSEEVDLKNATLVFAQVWDDLEREVGRENLVFPKEIMWLGGAPGAGKGTNTPFIVRERGLTAPPVVMSSLLQSPEMKALIDAGQLVGDREVVAILLRELLKPIYESGVVVDGFPRSAVQVECVRALFQKMHELRREYFDTPIGPKFRRPLFRCTILYVSEQVAVERQLKRGREIIAHNEEVARSGVGDVQEVRATDIEPALAAERYRVFREQSFAALESLRDLFHYHLIDANGSIESIEHQIKEDFQYQSSLELGQDTHDSIRNIPVADDLAVHARQELVRRLDNFRHRHAERFARVVQVIEARIVPNLILQANVGRAVVRLEEAVLDEPDAIGMFIDVLTERGYYPTVDCIEQVIPVSIDLQTGGLINTRRRLWQFEIRFNATAIRSGGQPSL